MSPPWQRITFYDSIKKYIDEDLYDKPVDELQKTAKGLGIETESFWDKGKLLDEIFSEKVEPNLIQPTFITDYPIELSPLAKKHRNDPKIAERFEGYVAAQEICNSFSELNDPIDQYERFKQQALLREAGDEEALVLDEDYIRALEYGMPPTAGLGIGVDRFVALLTDASTLREVILFPQMRPEK